MNFATAVDPERLVIDRDRVPEPLYPPLWTHFEVYKPPPEPEPVIKKSQRVYVGIPRKGTALRRIYDYLETHEWAESSEISVACMIQRRIVATFLSVMRIKGLLESQGTHKHMKWRIAE